MGAEQTIITMIVIPLIAAAIGSVLTVIFRRPPNYSMFLEAVRGWRDLTMATSDDEYRMRYVAIEAARLERLIHQHPAVTTLHGTDARPSE